MSKLEKSLARWVSLGFIDKKQADTIQHYETTNTDTSWNIFAWLILGASIIGIGIISVIAANWASIPDDLKLIADFSFLLIISLFIFNAWTEDKALRFEILVLFFMLMCLASIGLISQIYNTGGDFYQALMLWSLITFPLTLVPRKGKTHVVIPLTWLSGYIVASVCTLENSPAFTTYFHGDIMPVIMTIPLLCGLLTVMIRWYDDKTRYSNSLQIWFYASVIVAICAAEINYATSSSYHPYEYFFSAYLPGYLVAILAGIVIVASDYKPSQKTVLAVGLLLYLLSFSLPLTDSHSSLMVALFTFTELALLAAFVASIQNIRLFNWIIMMIGIRFLILYFQALGGLATTGFGLIISGLLIIFMAIYWNKYKSAIARWTEGWMQ